MKPVLLVSLLLSTLALAGCTSDPAGTDGSVDDGMDGESADEPGIGLPEWQVGHWWTYETTFPIETFTMAVSEDTGSAWVMDTDHQELAFFHSLGPISYLGDIRKSDLAGSQDAGAVEWLDFPLEDGKTWTATWDGVDFDMVSHVSDDLAHIVASVDGTDVNSMVYDASVGWFTSMSWGDPETGEEYGRMDLTDSGSGFTGELVRVDPEVVSEASNQGVMNQGLRLWGELDADDADAYLIYTVTCETGAFEFGVGTIQGAVSGNTGGAVPGEPQGHSINVQCNGGVDEAYAGIIGEAPGNGDSWGDYIVSQSPDLQLDYTLYLRHFERITL